MRREGKKVRVRREGVPRGHPPSQRGPGAGVADPARSPPPEVPGGCRRPTPPPSWFAHLPVCKEESRGGVVSNGRESNQSLFFIFDKVIKTETLAHPLRGPRRARLRAALPPRGDHRTQAEPKEAVSGKEVCVWGGSSLHYYFF